jgi:hypothetical protein
MDQRYRSKTGSLGLIHLLVLVKRGLYGGQKIIFSLLRVYTPGKARMLLSSRHNYRRFMSQVVFATHDQIIFHDVCHVPLGQTSTSSTVALSVSTHPTVGGAFYKPVHPQVNGGTKIEVKKGHMSSSLPEPALPNHCRHTSHIHCAPIMTCIGTLIGHNKPQLHHRCVTFLSIVAGSTAKTASFEYTLGLMN